MERPLLFGLCPDLRDTVSWITLGEYPTPVEKLEGLCTTEGLSDLYIKRDDLSSPLYGGNKVRKLEFLLARARYLGYGSVLTYGAAGSNHVLATVIHSGRLGLKTVALLAPQPNAAYVRKNLLLDYAHGALFAVAETWGELPGALLHGIISGRDPVSGKPPYLIPPGGSNIWGTLGYLEAAMELKVQVGEGLLPEPEYIFVTYGSGSTAAGLIVGARLAGLSGQVIPVRVVDGFACNRWLLGFHVNRAVRFLKRSCPGDAPGYIDPRTIPLINDFAGPTYARFTEEGMEAVRKAREHDGIKLEGTYTGKTMAAALDYIHRHRLEERPMLFWNTYSSAELFPAVAELDFHLLPTSLHRYFTEPLQEEEMGCEVIY